MNEEEHKSLAKEKSGNEINKEKEKEINEDEPLDSFEIIQFESNRPKPSSKNKYTTIMLFCFFIVLIAIVTLYFLNQSENIFNQDIKIFKLKLRRYKKDNEKLQEKLRKKNKKEKEKKRNRREKKQLVMNKKQENKPENKPKNVIKHENLTLHENKQLKQDIIKQTKKEAPIQKPQIKTTKIVQKAENKTKNFNKLPIKPKPSSVKPNPNMNINKGKANIKNNANENKANAGKNTNKKI